MTRTLTSVTRRRRGWVTHSGNDWRLVVAGLLLTCSGLTSAEEPVSRPRIGLVLSGGGALGAAHVGVLEVLEELQVPVDCVAGTSMGAIVGGLYAAGYAPSEMRSILLDIDWTDMLEDRPPRRRLPFRRKVDDLTFLSPFEMGFNRGRIQLPSALITGQKMDFLLQVLTIHTVGLATFDDLPTPFRAVATDLETGDEVVFASGDLGRVLRASMAVPGVFSPVEIDDRVLVDGGLVNNLPVNRVREMGADIVIAVDVGEDLRTRDELQSLSRVAGQVVGMMVRSNVESQLAGVDFLINPDMNGFGSTDFQKTEQMMPIGSVATRELAATLGELALDDAAWQEHRSRRLLPELQRPAHVVGVQIASTSDAEPAEVLRRVTIRPGDPLDVHVLARDLERLYEIGDYEKVSFQLTAVDGGYLLTIDAIRKAWGPNVMRFGLNLMTDLEGQSSFNLLANYTMTRLNRLRGELKLAVQVGEEPMLRAEFYQPLESTGRWFVAPRVEHVVFRSSLLISPDEFGEFKVDLTAVGADLGLSLGRFGELRAGVLRGTGNARARLGTENLEDMEVNWGGWNFRAVLDQIDDPNFPREGYLAVGELFLARESMGSDFDYDRLGGGFLGATSRGRHTLLLSFEGGSALGSELPIWGEFDVGGLFRLSGYSAGSFSGRYLALAVASYYYRVADMPTGLTEGVFLGFSVEAGNVWQDKADISTSDLLWSGSLYAAVDTIVGPLYAAWALADDGTDTWYLFIGRSF